MSLSKMLGARVQFHWIPNKHREPELLVLVLLLLPHCVLQRHRHLFSYLLFSSHTKREAAVPHPNSSLNTHPLPFSLPPARSAPHQKHGRKKVDTQTLSQPQLPRQARCCRIGNNDKLTLILQIRNIIIIVIIIRKQTHQRVRTVAHSQKLPTRVRSCRSRHASRCIPSTSVRRVDSGVTPARRRRRRRRPDPPLKTPPTSLLPIFLPLCWVPSTCSRSCDDSCATKRRWRRSPRRPRRRACASRRPDVRPGFRATDRNQARPSQFLGPKERRPLDVDSFSPTAGCRVFMDRWT